MRLHQVLHCANSDANVNTENVSLDHCLHLRLCDVKVDVDVNIDANANVMCEQGSSSN